MHDENHVFHIYVDDSSKSAEFIGLGAVFCRKDAAQQISAYLSKAVLDAEQRPDKEIHWTDLKRHLLPLYLQIGTTLISYTKIETRKMRYRALMVESCRIDRSLDTKANREDVLQKFAHTLISNFAQEHGQKLHYHVFIDTPSGEEGPSEIMLHSLNNDCKTRFGFSEKPFKQAEFVCSKKSRMIQAADLLTGAIAFETNKLHLAPNAAPHRLRLWSTLLEASGLETFAEPTPYWPKLFQIQHFDFEKSATQRKV